jgi:hypothetical protein
MSGICGTGDPATVGRQTGDDTPYRRVSSGRSSVGHESGGGREVARQAETHLAQARRTVEYGGPSNG